MLNKRFPLLVLIFIAIILCSLLLMRTRQQSIEAIKLLKQTQEDLFELKKRNIQLQKTIYANEQKLKQSQVPTFEYESVRRKVMQTIQEFWYFINTQMKELKIIFDSDVNSISIVNNVISTVFESTQASLNSMKKLTDADGFNPWREKESADLSNVVQKRFDYLQNPADCKNAKKILCSINYYCGFGCQMHHLIHGIIIAYGLERTLILESRNWQYHEGGWNEVFMPLSNSCITTDAVTTVDWPGSPDSPVIRLPLVDSLSPRSQYMPMAVPEDLVNRLKIIHGNPIIWWIRQILKYAWKLQPRTTRYINNQMERFGIKHPFVSVQVRRTDKINKESKFHSIEKYMDVVDEYYNSIDLKTNITKRRVYIATEDYSVITETKAKYPQYEILYNQNIPTIPKLHPIHLFDNIFDLILDIHILRQSDLLVCTFSSNICRLLYTLMDSDYIDESANLISIDSVYYYNNQDYNKRKVILNHNAEDANEIDLIPGDIIGVDEYSLNGYFFGTNFRTKKSGWFPSFKVEVQIEIVKFPTYSNIDNKKT